MRTIILIAGLARSGKDTSAEMFKEILGDNCKILHFADNLKDIICSTFNINRDELDYLKNNSEEWRGILQRFGSDAMKPVFGDSVWTDLITKDIVASNNEVILIPDFRFRHEFIDLHRNFSKSATKIITIRVQKEGQVNAYLHSSENDLNGFLYNYIIVNDGRSYKTLKRQIDKICKGEGLGY